MDQVYHSDVIEQVEACADACPAGKEEHYACIDLLGYCPYDMPAIAYPPQPAAAA